MIGIIFHYGLYSVPAYDDIKSARRRKMQNGSEWYSKRLLEDGKYRPISGYKSTQEYHNSNYTNKKYEDFIKLFNPDIQKIEKWFKLAVQINAKYVILTTKHHDGFCLWDTKTTKFKSKLDLVQIFKEFCTKYNLKFGIYYSWSEFNKSCTIKFINEIVIPQIKELQKYNPDIFWFDGHWELKTKFAKETITKLVLDLKNENKEIEINDRIPIESSDLNYLGNSTYRVYSDRFIPTEVPKVPWEHINTIGLSWGRNKDQEEKDYKIGKDLYELYKKIKNLNGKFLINLGPEADGELDYYEQKSLIEFSELIKADNK